MVLNLHGEIPSDASSVGSLGHLETFSEAYSDRTSVS